MFIIALPLAGVQAEAHDLQLATAVTPAIEARHDAAQPSLTGRDNLPTGDSPPPADDAASQANPAEPDDSIVITARPAPPPSDPLQGLNLQSFSVVQSVDDAVTGPVSMAYKNTVPSPIRSGLRNVLSNLQEPIVSLNYLLQLKPGKSLETLGRFAINSTIGVAGLFDVAKKPPFKLPRRTNGFGYTLGYYGVKPGPYLYLPLMGPTTVRDLIGRVVDLSVLPFAVGKPFNKPAFAIPTTVIRLLDERAEGDEAMRELLDDSADPYDTIRTNYLRTRQAEIDALHGKHRQNDPAPAPAPAAEPEKAVAPSGGE